MRRALQVRRAACKDKAVRDGDAIPSDFPIPKAHPTKGRPDETIQIVQAIGPTGYFIAALVRLGMMIDSDFKIWQRHEPPIDLLHVPYHWIKPLISEAANRARTRADWSMKDIKVALREIDVDATKAEHVKLDM